MSNADDDNSLEYEKLPVTGRPVPDAAPAVPGTPPEGGTGIRRVLATRGDFRSGFEAVLGMVKRELRIFDPDLAEYGFNAPAVDEALRKFLQASRTNRVLIVVHDTTYITQSCPRLLRLLKDFSHAVLINQTDEAIRKLDDVLVVGDDEHYLRRPRFDQPKGVMMLCDAAETRGWLNRFEEIWAASAQAVSATTIGL
jgi:hypothetical protein